MTEYKLTITKNLIEGSSGFSPEVVLCIGAQDECLANMNTKLCETHSVFALLDSPIGIT